jgi:hypothetical protein
MDMLAVTIATHRAYEEVTLPVLLPTLLPAIFPVIVYASGHDHYTETLRYDGMVRYVTLPYNAFEYSPLIEQADHPTADYIHVLHDTTVVGPQYVEKLTAYVRMIVTDMLTIECVANTSMCGMWLYATDALARHREELQSFKNMSKQDAIKHEGWFSKYRRGTTHTVLDAVTCDYIERDVYRTGSRRITEYHPAFDVTKYKANYGQRDSGKHNAV